MGVGLIRLLPLEVIPHIVEEQFPKEDIDLVLADEFQLLQKQLLEGVLQLVMNVAEVFPVLEEMSLMSNAFIWGFTVYKLTINMRFL